LAFVGIGVALTSWLVVATEVTQTQSQALLAIPGVIGLVILAPTWYIWLGLRLRRAG
jgi:hypothetical protein